MGTRDPLWAGAGLDRRMWFDADAVFATLTDLRALPNWAYGIGDVLEVPAKLAPGAVWRSSRPGRSHREVHSTVTTFDPGRRRFAHHSCPVRHGRAEAYSEWRWECVPESSGGSRLHVGWVLRPAAGGARLLATAVWQRRLRAEMTDALARLEDLCATRSVRTVRVEPEGAEKGLLPG